MNNPFEVNPFLGFFGQGYGKDKEKPMDMQTMMALLKMQQEAPRSLRGDAEMPYAPPYRVALLPAHWDVNGPEEGFAGPPQLEYTPSQIPTEIDNMNPFLAGPVNWDQNAGNVDLMAGTGLTGKDAGKLASLLAGSSYEPPIPKRWVQAAGLARMNPIAAYAFQQAAQMKRRGQR